MRGLSPAMTLLVPVLGRNYDVLHSFKEVEYVWASDEERQEALDSGAFIVENNAITGLKACNSDVSSACGDETRLFATVPRWRPGVPGTLAEVVSSADGRSLLQPWPDRASQDPEDCSKIQYVQSMEITPDGLMWILDVGRKYFASEVADNACPPKMVLVDIESKEVVDSYVFPSQVAPYTGSFLNDIVVDVDEQWAFISSTGNNATDLGAVVLYDRFKRISRRFEHPSTHAENRSFNVHAWDSQGFPVDGIALTPDRKRLYYCALSGLGLYSISTDAFRESSQAAEASLISHGEKPDISDGMAFGSDGSLFFGGLQTDALYRWHPDSGVPVAEAEILGQSEEDLYWIDTLAFDNRGKLLVTSNKLAAFFDPNQTLDPSEENFRIVSFDVGTNSYMQSSAAAVIV